MMSGTIGLLFPGQGSQSVGMGKAFCEADPALRQHYEEAEKILGYDLASLCFEGPAETLNRTEYTQPALLVTSVVAFEVLQPFLPPVTAVAGHSLGEYSALVAAQGISFSDAVGLVQQRAQFMAQAVPPGSGLVVAVLGAERQIVEEVCKEAQAVGVVSAANFNCPGQIVIAGVKEAVDRVCELLKERGCRRVKSLPVSVPVHTSLMQPAADRFTPAVQAVPLMDLQVPLINNVAANSIQTAKEVRNSLIAQLPSPVLWENSISKMWDLGIRTFIEVGPGSVLSGLVKRIVPEATTLVVNDPSSLEATKHRLCA